MGRSWAFLLAGLSLSLCADDRTLTRAEVFAPITETSLIPERNYVELDLNGDGVNEIILSESLSLGGTGGQVYNLYASVGPDRFQQVDEFIGADLATEVHDGGIRLWSYHRLGALCGTIGYRYFDGKGVLQKSANLEIQTGGDSGSKTANAILRVIFNERTVLKPKTWGKAAPGAVPEPATHRP